MSDTHSGAGDMLGRWRQHATQLKRDTYAIYLAFRDSRVPWYARVLAICVVAYALSPIDLIPDFIPVLGYVDDLVLVPLGIALVLRLIPMPVLEESRQHAHELLSREGGPRDPAARRAAWGPARAVALTIIVIWGVIATLAAALLVRALRGG
jgi:uncharacterized membrane protein YkvA (DUF1232 family)